MEETKRRGRTGRYVRTGEQAAERVDGREGGQSAERAPEQVAARSRAAEVRVGAPRPAYCRLFTRARFAEALPEVAATLLEEAKKGSVAHLKLLVQISGLDKGDVTPARRKRKGTSLERLLKEAFEKNASSPEAADAETFPDTSGE